MSVKFSSDKELGALKPEAKKYKAYDAVESGLYVLITSVKNGQEAGKTFRYDFKFEGKRQTLTLGRYSAMSLAEARNRCRQAKNDIAQGINPALVKQQRKAQAKAEAEAIKQEKEDQGNVLSKVVTDWLSLKSVNLRKATLTKLNGVLNNYILPVLGEKPIKTITQDDLLSVLKTIEDKGYKDTAHTACSRLKEIFSHAMLRNYIEKDVSFGLDKLLKPLIADEREHYAAVTDAEEIADMIQKIDGYLQNHNIDLPISCAMRIYRYLPLRKNELLGLLWKEVDLDNARITISKDRMKIREEFTLPLSEQAVSILRQLDSVRYSDFVFWSTQKNGRPISDVGVKNHFSNAGVPQIKQSLHGWRTTFSSLCNVSGAPYDIVERCLSHKVGNEIERTYNRANYEIPMRRLMQWCADAMDALAEGKEVPALDVSSLYKK